MIGTEQQNEVLRQLHPKGASIKTSEGYQLTGVDYSDWVAAKDSENIGAYIAKRFVEAGAAYHIPPALLAAIASRESRMGKYLTPGGWGDRQPDGSYAAFGIMQIDKRSHPIPADADPFGLDHIRQAAEIINNIWRQIAAKHSDWTFAQQLMGAIAGYNEGVRNVRTLAGMDDGTTHDDYADDVVRRAQYLAGFIRKQESTS